MADIKNARSAPVQAGTFANKWYTHQTFKPAAAAVAGDVVILNPDTPIPAGTKLLDAVAFVEDPLTDLALSLGFRHVNGAAGDDAAYFFGATNVAAGGKFRASANKPPVVLLHDAFLVATLGGAAFPTANQLDVIVDYDFVGPPTFTS